MIRLEFRDDFKFYKSETNIGWTSQVRGIPMLRLYAKTHKKNNFKKFHSLWTQVAIRLVRINDRIHEGYITNYYG